MSSRSMAKQVLVSQTIGDLVSKFLYYDRKEDEDLPRGAIQKMIRDGAISVDWIVDEFRDELVKGLKQ